MERRYQSDNGRLSRTRRPYQCRHRSRLRVERDTMQYCLLRFVREFYVLELYSAANRGQRHTTFRVFVLRSLAKHLARALQSCDGLRDLRADVHYLKQRRRQIAQEHRVSEKSTQGQGAS